ncbi:MAG: 4Fe-4S binding protein [Bacteroidetes bacterium]|nr:4Fe-4S binding protein [Bacteroidota bacterium]
MKLKFSGLLFVVSLFVFFSTAHAGLIVTNAKQTNAVQQEDEFSQPGDEFSEPGDEFEQPGNEFATVGDEFAQTSETPACCPSAACTTDGVCPRDEAKFNWILGLLIATIVAGFLVRIPATRNLRGVFLLVSLFLIGFYKGGCLGCPVDGVQSFFLGIFGFEDGWRSWVWFIAIIPITYLLGRVWCGWICHFGALQEFLYLPGRVKWFKTETAQKVAFWIRVVLTVALIVQLAVMGTRYWCYIDPFASIFNFGSFYDFVIGAESYNADLIIGITLVLLILVMSVFTFRPFCRFMCPAGLMMGLVAKIPGASVIGLKAECSGCKNCSNVCKINAIIRKEKYSILNNTECILCGDCMEACNKKGLILFRKSRKHKDIVHCTNDCQI